MYCTRMNEGGKRLEFCTRCGDEVHGGRARVDLSRRKCVGAREGALEREIFLGRVHDAAFG